MHNSYTSWLKINAWWLLNQVTISYIHAFGAELGLGEAVALGDEPADVPVLHVLVRRASPRQQLPQQHAVRPLCEKK